MLASHDKALHDPAIQTLSAESLVVLSERSMAAVIERLAGTIYAERRRGSADELAVLPVMSGEEFATEVVEHPPFGRLRIEGDDLIRAGLATAGVPQPTPIAWSRTDLDDEAVLGARALWRAGLRPRGRGSDCLDGGLIAPGTLAVTDALDALDALALPVGPLTSDAALQRATEVWEIVRPQLLIADAASHAFLRQSSTAPRDLPLLVLLTPADADRLAAPPEADVCRVFSLPQACTFLAGECPQRDGSASPRTPSRSRSSTRAAPGRCRTGRPAASSSRPSSAPSPSSASTPGSPPPSTAPRAPAAKPTPGCASLDEIPELLGCSLLVRGRPLANQQLNGKQPTTARQIAAAATITTITTATAALSTNPSRRPRIAAIPVENDSPIVPPPSRQRAQRQQRRRGARRSANRCRTGTACR